MSLNYFNKAFCVAAFLLLLPLASLQANSIDTHEFETEEQRQLFLKLGQELRCPKCQNQNIGDSNSQIAIDLRNQVARLVSQNQSEDEIKTYMVNRYGDFVLYEPPFNAGTLILWGGPFLMLGLGLLVFFLSVAKRRSNLEDNSETEREEELS